MDDRHALEDRDDRGRVAVTERDRAGRCSTSPSYDATPALTIRAKASTIVGSLNPSSQARLQNPRARSSYGFL